MSVATFDPNQISVTPAAQAHIGQQIARSEHKFLRLGVKESGCNGYMYTLDYIDTPAANDQRFQVSPDLAVYISSEDLRMVAGTQVDLVTEGLNTSLKFKNPNAESHCGCGESFSVATADGA